MDCNYLTREIKAIVIPIIIFLLYKYSIPSKNILYILSRSIRTNSSFFSSFQFPFFLKFLFAYLFILSNLRQLVEARANLIVRSRSISTISLQILQEVVINETGLTVRKLCAFVCMYPLEQEIKLSI